MLLVRRHSCSKLRKTVKNGDRSAIFAPLLFLDERTAVGTFLLFLVLFPGTGAGRRQAGLSAAAVQTRLRRPRPPRARLSRSGRKEGRKAREGDGTSNFPVFSERDLKENVSRSWG